MNLTPGNRSYKSDADDVDRQPRGARVGAEVGEGIVQPPFALDHMMVDEHELDVGRIAGGAKAFVAGESEDRVIAQRLQMSDELAAARGVAVDHDGLGGGLRGVELRQHRHNPARPRERLPRVERHKRPRGGEASAAAGR
jgi:hypothetical protein